MRLREWLEDLPVEDAAANLARMVRRVRRRLARRREGVALLVAVGIGSCVVVTNALWSQTERHPSPMWPVVERVAEAPPDVVRAPPEEPPSDLLREVQDALRLAGAYEGPVDGRESSATSAAIAAFEREAGLAVTAEPSVALLAAVATAAAEPEPRPVLPVIELQRRLNARGFGPLAEDGKMGPRTQAALDAFAATLGVDPAGAAVMAELARTEG